MSYGGYRGRNIGRLLHFLYRMTHHADYFIFHGDNHDPMITYGQKTPAANYTWVGDSDVPKFEFLGEYKWLNDPMTVDGKIMAVKDFYTQEILDAEKFANRKPWSADEDKPKPPQMGWVEDSKKWEFREPITPTSTIYDVIAIVKKRADGRFSYRQSKPYFDSKKYVNKQGVSLTLLEAQTEALK